VLRGSTRGAETLFAGAAEAHYGEKLSSPATPRETLRAMADGDGLICSIWWKKWRAEIVKPLDPAGW